MEFDRGEISYVPTTGVRSVHEAPLVAATELDPRGVRCADHRSPYLSHRNRALARTGLASD